jgi:hypothetical protein
MRPWIALAAKLYPRRWRERYGAEFDALMEDVEPDGRELANVLGGALKMQLKSETAYFKLAAVLGAIGAVAALGVSLRVPEQYQSTAVMRVTSDSQNQFELMKGEILSRNSLAELIQRPSLNLYRGERQRIPMEDVIQLMKRNIRIAHTPDGTVSIAFTYPDGVLAQSVVNDLVGKLVETNLVVNRNRQDIFRHAWKEDGPAGTTITVIRAASEWQSVGQTNRIAWAVAGLLFGALVAAWLRWPRPALMLTAFAVAGCIIGTALSYTFGARYTSSAVLRISPPIDPKRWYASRAAEPLSDHVGRIASQILSDDSLRELMLRPQLNLYADERARMPIAQVIRNMREHAVHIELLPPTGWLMSFTYTDPAVTQAVMREFVTKVVEGEVTGQRSQAVKYGGEFQMMFDRKIGENVEVLDPSSLPVLPVWPNRAVMAMLGAGVGLLLGIVIMMVRWMRGPATVRAAAAPAV